MEQPRVERSRAMARPMPLDAPLGGGVRWRVVDVMEENGEVHS